MKSYRSLLIESYKLGMRGEDLKKASKIHEIEKWEMYNQAWFCGIRGMELEMVLDMNPKFIRYYINGWRMGMRGEDLRKIRFFYFNENDILEYFKEWTEKIDNIKKEAKDDLGMDMDHYNMLMNISSIEKMELFIEAYSSNIRGKELEDLLKIDDENYIRDFIGAWRIGLKGDQIKKFIDLGDPIERNLYCKAIESKIFNEEYIDKILESKNLEKLLKVLESHHKENNK